MAKQTRASTANLGFEDKLWAAADKLRGNMDAAEYKHVVLGLIFLKYISDAFMEKFTALQADDLADPEDKDEYLADNIFWVPSEARWSHLQKNAKIADTYHAWRTVGPHPGPLPKGEGVKQHYRGGFDFSGLVQRTRELRKKQTPAEAVMWELLRNRQFMDLKFRRQHQIGEYVVDFYCDERKLVVELDGPIHGKAKQAKKDKKRDAYMQSLGLTVLRFENADFLANPESVLQAIASQRPSPRGRGAGGEGNPEMAAYADIPGFCKSVSLQEIEAHGHVLTPGRFVGAEEIEDDGIPFEEKMAELSAELYAQMAEAEELDAAIRRNLEVLGYGE